MRQLVLGGARSGKSRYGERWVQDQAHRANTAPWLIATADWRDSDFEMQSRIERHRNDRAPNWQCIEEPFNLARLLVDRHTKGAPLLIDCLTLWISNCLAADCWPQQRAAFLAAFSAYEDDITLVSNEVGLGVVPLGEVSRCFMDASGFLHQTLAELCDRVVFCAAGLPLVMKGQ